MLALLLPVTSTVHVSCVHCVLMMFTRSTLFHNIHAYDYSLHTAYTYTTAICDTPNDDVTQHTFRYKARISRYRNLVLRCQRRVRDYLSCRAARLELIRLLWWRLERGNMIADRSRLQQTKTVKSSSFRRSKLRPRKQPDSAERSVKDKTDGHRTNSGSVAYSDDCDRSIRMFSDGKHMTCLYSIYKLYIHINTYIYIIWYTC
jgi:hypothetical protein